MKLLTLSLIFALLLGCTDNSKVERDKIVAERVKQICEQVGGQLGFGLELTNNWLEDDQLTRSYFCMLPKNGVEI